MAGLALPLLALLTGALVPLQLAFNGQLGAALRSPLLAAFAVMLTGVAATGAALLVTRTPLPGLRDLAAVPPLAWAGGGLATLYILAVVALVPRLGVGAAAVLIIAGQVVAALLLDRLGLIGATQAITPTRALGAALVVAGAALVRWG